MGGDIGARGRVVRAAMARLHMNQRDLCRVAGVNPSTVSDFLNGHRLPRLATLAKLETALKLEPGSLVNGEPVDVFPVSEPVGVLPSGLSAYTTRELLAELASRVELLDELAARAAGRTPR